jgi:hypothetical protein
MSQDEKSMPIEVPVQSYVLQEESDDELIKPQKRRRDPLALTFREWQQSRELPAIDSQWPHHPQWSQRCSDVGQWLQLLNVFATISWEPSWYRAKILAADGVAIPDAHFAMVSV